MNGITAKKALLELCLGLENKKAAKTEERNEKRLQGDKDWTGKIVERFINKCKKKELEAMGFEIYPDDWHLDVFPKIKR